MRGFLCQEQPVKNWELKLAGLHASPFTHAEWVSRLICKNNLPISSILTHFPTTILTALLQDSKNGYSTFDFTVILLITQLFTEITH